MAYTTIDDPSEYFHTRLYTGNGSTQSITNNANAGNFPPDWVWTKGRSDADNNSVFDTTRGANKELVTNGNGAEATGTNLVTSFDSNGFSLGNNAGVNGSGDTYVAWQWKANGGTTSSNSDGSITSTVQANTTAGFSIITYTGTGSTATIGHGLNSAPEMIITKGRSDAHSWLVGVTADSSDLSKVLVLQTTAASVTATSNYNAAPNSSTYQVVNAGGTNNNADTYVAYVFHSVQGYSKIGSYTGNGNADGTFVYTGFKPAWVMTKRTDSSDHWRIVDATREPFNDGSMQGLKANTNEAEADAGSRGLDFLSNGFKIRTTDPDSNASGGDYIYMAFAEHPFVSSEGVPTTAR
tara:strand:+ start:511 stop:1566 length:1056 start_codon:yes stop_codon:yes gene_type:complete